MNLGNHRINPQVAVSDIERAVAFYEGTLGLTPQGVQREGSRAYGCGDSTKLYVYAAPSHAGKATATLARWDVDDIDDAVAGLTARGVRFERYGEPVPTDDRGIHDSGYGKVAWFKDPDGNTFALEQR
jgi:catechol 2,3-dioxygenase-like lactoylglutathione lyase family enzyme